ncbi:MAG: DUF1361 domain-containing protein [Chitinophagaceae bacterium]|nr:DUF1361 domain-containing protein [Chitinophagaceae bacterium]
MTKATLLLKSGFPLPVTLHHWLLVSSGFSCLLLTARMIVTDSLEYIFLPWNLFLAFVPYWITQLTARRIDIIENKWKLFLMLVVWLLFIPNAFYIITDLVHFARVRSAPKWFDLLLIFSFAWNGIMFGIVSLRKVELITAVIRGKHFSVTLVFAVMWLNALGIYIGRYLRFNSWDVITDPFSLVAEISDLLFNPLQNSVAWGMTLCYAVFMTLLYLSVKKLGESFTV